LSRHFEGGGCAKSKKESCCGCSGANVANPYLLLAPRSFKRPLRARSGSRKCIVHRSLIDCGQIRTLKLIGPVNEDACIPSFGLLLSVKRNVFHNDSPQVQITSKCYLQAHQFSEGITFIYVKRLT